MQHKLRTTRLLCAGVTPVNATAIPADVTKRVALGLPPRATLVLLSSGKRRSDDSPAFTQAAVPMTTALATVS